MPLVVLCHLLTIYYISLAFSDEHLCLQSVILLITPVEFKVYFNDAGKCDNVGDRRCHRMSWDGLSMTLLVFVVLLAVGAVQHQL